MSLQKIVLYLTFLLIASTGFSQVKMRSCSIFKFGTFKYLDAIDTTAYVVMTGNKQIEYSGKNNYTIDQVSNGPATAVIK